MNAVDLRKISAEVQASLKDLRLDQYIGWISRDLLTAAKRGKFSHKFDYSDRPLPNEFIVRMQDSFLADGYGFDYPDPNNMRIFVISWSPSDD